MTNSFSWMASLAEASYVQFDKLASEGKSYLIDDDVAYALEVDQYDKYSGNYSILQAADFVNNWSIAHHQEDTNSGFSATLFKGKYPSSSQPYSLAIRGTQEADDLLVTDLQDIVLDGLAIDQIVDLYNYWNMISTPEGEPYEAFEVVDLIAETVALQLIKGGATFIPALNMTADAFLEWIDSNSNIIVDNNLAIERVRIIKSVQVDPASNPYEGLGILNEIELSTVTGHSLGGHLATAFSRLFGDLDVNTIAINGAGFATGAIPGLGGDAERNISNLFYTLGGLDTFPSSRITNLYGDRYPEFVTQNGELGLFQQGLHESIYIEHSSIFGKNSNLLGHGKEEMTNSLAVYDLFFQLDESINSSPIETILSKYLSLFYTTTADDSIGNAILAGKNSTLETVVNQLAKLFSVNLQILDDQIDKRENLFKSIYEIRNSQLFQHAVNLGNLRITPLSSITIDAEIISLSSSDITTRSSESNSDGLAYRYAIKHLNSFVILGDESIYDSHKANGDLELYDVTNNNNGMTSDYITDRSIMLSIHLQRNTADSQLAITDGQPPTSWIDLDNRGLKFTNNQLFVGLLDGELHKTVNKQIIFGGDDNDLIEGGRNVDHLYGSSGNDILEGKDGADYLEGGEDYDTRILVISAPRLFMRLTPFQYKPLQVF